MRRLAVLGAGGWLGAHVAESARRDGWSVAAIGRRAAAGVEVVAPDLAALAAAIEHATPQAVVNCIGSKSANARELIAGNIDVVGTVVDASSRVGARLVHVGSAAEYGDPGLGPAVEGRAVAPGSDYGRSKALATSLVAQSDADAVAARVFNIAGSSPPPGSFVLELLNWVLTTPDGSIEMLNPDLVRDWVTIDGVVASLLALASSSGGARIVNVCSGVGFTHGDIVRAIAAHLGVPVDVRSLGRPGIASVIGDPSQLHAQTGLDLSVPASVLAAAICGDRRGLRDPETRPVGSPGRHG